MFRVVLSNFKLLLCIFLSIYFPYIPIRGENTFLLPYQVVFVYVVGLSALFITKNCPSEGRSVAYITSGEDHHPEDAPDTEDEGAPDAEVGILTCLSAFANPYITPGLQCQVNM